MSSDDIRESIRLLTQLTLRSHERLDELQAAQTNSERKIAALADAQIRLEEAQANSERKIAALADAQIRTEAAMANLTEKMAQLAASQAHTDQRLDALIDIVREGRNGKGGA
jgi:DNA anti-recombination protein RmuC